MSELLDKYGITDPVVEKSTPLLRKYGIGLEPEPEKEKDPFKKAAKDLKRYGSPYIAALKSKTRKRTVPNPLLAKYGIIEEIPAKPRGWTDQDVYSRMWAAITPFATEKEKKYGPLRPGGVIIPPEMNDYIRYKWKMGEIPLGRGLIYKDALLSSKFDDKLDEVHKKARSYVLTQMADANSRGTFEDAKWEEPIRKMAGGAAELGPFMLYASKESAAYAMLGGLAGAGAAAAIGAPTGLLLTPPGMITAVGITAAGTAAGSTYGMVKAGIDIEGANLFGDLTFAGIPPRIARPISFAAGAVIGAIEQWQIKGIARTFTPAMGKALSKLILKYFVEVGKEVGEEVAQEAVTIAGEVAAWALAGKKPKTRLEIKKRLMETAKQSLPGLMGLMLPGTTLSAIQTIANVKLNKETLDELTKTINEGKLQGLEDSVIAKQLAVKHKITEEAAAKIMPLITAKFEGKLDIETKEVAEKLEGVMYVTSTDIDGRSKTKAKLAERVRESDPDKPVLRKEANEVLPNIKPKKGIFKGKAFVRWSELPEGVQETLLKYMQNEKKIKGGDYNAGETIQDFLEEYKNTVWWAGGDVFSGDAVFWFRGKIRKVSGVVDVIKDLIKDEGIRPRSITYNALGFKTKELQPALGVTLNMNKAVTDEIQRRAADGTWNIVPIEEESTKTVVEGEDFDTALVRGEEMLKREKVDVVRESIESLERKKGKLISENKPTRVIDKRIFNLYVKYNRKLASITKEALDKVDKEEAEARATEIVRAERKAEEALQKLKDQEKLKEDFEKDAVPSRRKVIGKEGTVVNWSTEQLNNFRRRVELGEDVVNKIPVVKVKSSVDPHLLKFGAGISKKRDKIYISEAKINQLWDDWVAGKRIFEKLEWGFSPNSMIQEEFNLFVEEHERVHLATGLDGGFIDENMVNIIALERIGRNDLANAIEIQIQSKLYKLGLGEKPSKQIIRKETLLGKGKGRYRKLEGILGARDVTVMGTASIPAETNKMFDKVLKDIEIQKIKRRESKHTEEKIFNVDKEGFFEHKLHDEIVQDDEIAEQVKDQFQKKSEVPTRPTKETGKEDYAAIDAAGVFERAMQTETMARRDYFEEDARYRDNIKGLKKQAERKSIIGTEEEKILKKERDPTVAYIYREPTEAVKVILKNALESEDRRHDVQERYIRRKYGMTKEQAFGKDIEEVNQEVDDTLEKMDEVEDFLGGIDTDVDTKEKPAPTFAGRKFSVLLRMVLNAVRLTGGNENALLGYLKRDKPFNKNLRDMLMGLTNVAKQMKVSIIRQFYGVRNAESLYQLVAARVNDIIFEVISKRVAAEIKSGKIKATGNFYQRMNQRKKAIESYQYHLGSVIQETGINEDDPFGHYWYTEIGNGFIHKIDPSLKDPSFQGNSFVKNYKAFLDFMGIDYSDADLVQWKIERPKAAYTKHMPPDLLKLALWLNSDVQRPMLKGLIKADVVTDADLFRRIRMGFVHSAFNLETGAGVSAPSSGVRSTYVPKRRWDTKEEFYEAVKPGGPDNVEGKRLVLIDNLGIQIGEYIKNSLMKMHMNVLFKAFGDLTNPENDKLHVVEYAEEHETSTESGVSKLTGEGYTQFNVGSGLAKWKNGQYMVPWLPEYMVETLNNYLKSDAFFLQGWNTFNSIHKRAVMLSPLMFYLQILSTPALYLKASNSWEFLQPAIPLLSGYGWKKGTKQLLKGDPRGLLSILAPEMITKGSEIGRQMLMQNEKQFGHLEDNGYDPKLLELFMEEGFSSISWNWIYASLFEKAEMLHPSQRSMASGLSNYATTKGGMDLYVFNYLIPKMLYQTTEMFYNGFREGSVPILGYTQITGKRVKLPWAKAYSDRDAARLAVKLTQDLTGVLNSNMYNWTEKHWWRTLLFARDFTISFARQITGATAPAWTKFVQDRYKTKGINQLFNAMRHSETTEADLNVLWGYYVNHLLVTTPIAYFTMINLVQFGLISLFGDDEEKKKKWAYQNDPGKKYLIRTPWKDPRTGKYIYIAPLFWREPQQLIEFAGLPVEEGRHPLLQQVEGGRGAMKTIRNKLSGGMVLVTAGLANIHPRTGEAIISAGATWVEKLNDTKGVILDQFTSSILKTDNPMAWVGPATLFGFAPRTGEFPTTPLFTPEELRRQKTLTQRQAYLDKKARIKMRRLLSDQEIMNMAFAGEISVSQALTEIRSRKDKALFNLLPQYQAAEKSRMRRETLAPSWAR